MGDRDARLRQGTYLMLSKERQSMASAFDRRIVCLDRRRPVVIVMPIQTLYVTVSKPMLQKGLEEERRHTNGVMETQFGVPPFRSL